MKRWRLLEKKRKRRELENRVMLKIILAKVNLIEMKANRRAY